MLTQLKLNRLMALMVLCGLLALLAWPAQAQYGEFDLDGVYIQNGVLMILIKEGHDEFVECLRWAANQGTVEIGGCTQITGLIAPGLKATTYAELWDQLAADTGLIRIRPLSGATDFGRRFFVLIFPPFPDRLTAYRLYYFYVALLPYVDVSFSEIASIPAEEMPSAISETTWGFIKHRGLKL